MFHIFQNSIKYLVTDTIVILYSIILTRWLIMVHLLVIGVYRYYSDDETVALPRPSGALLNSKLAALKKSRAMLCHMIWKQFYVLQSWTLNYVIFNSIRCLINFFCVYFWGYKRAIPVLGFVSLLLYETIVHPRFSALL